MHLLRLLIGILLLVLGRQLFWLFVGGIGFVAAIDLVTRLADAWPAWLTLLVALGAGIIGALLAIFLQEFAIGVAGFLGGGYVVLAILRILDLQMPLLSWLLVLVGAIIGVVLALAMFDWALILLSSLSGAAIVAQTLSAQLFDLNRPLTLLIFFVGLVLGILIQARGMAGGTAYYAESDHA
jgi:hypothetical protein